MPILCMPLSRGSIPYGLPKQKVYQMADVPMDRALSRPQDGCTNTRLSKPVVFGRSPKISSTVSILFFNGASFSRAIGSQALARPVSSSFLRPIGEPTRVPKIFHSRIT